ncbi:lipid phosphate phosphatase 2-like isoform X4 [Canna indica]|uniref:Lipid phosphate phosphatase 2-like isoform X4 n=1 Tax=Canna indica TaxID=4628 RepID=A0AAQ3Q9T7_9LILI|nr:lipid phosphate phosphatase 2-like isoform X4 [Canna indica]
MREVRLGSYTVQSHGIEVVKAHKFDWLILILLVALLMAIRVVHPFYRFVGKDMMSYLRYPFKTNTVPPWALYIIAIVLPAAVIVAFYVHRREVYDLHHAILGLLFSVLITAIITDALKDAVGRPRPDFFWRCFPNGTELYDKVTGNVICHGEKKVMDDGHKGFPSGHTSLSFAGLGYLALYLSGKVKAFDRKGHVGKLCFVFLPLLVSSLIGVSRVDDYKHHWDDVFVGGIIGLTVATSCYLQFFPAPHHSDGWGPYAYFQALEAHPSRSNTTSMVNQRVQGSGVVELGYLGCTVTGRR